MRHVFGFVCLFLYLLIQMRSNAEDGTESNLTVILFLIKCCSAYAVGYLLYKPIHRAWRDSKR